MNRATSPDVRNTAEGGRGGPGRRFEPPGRHSGPRRSRSKIGEQRGPARGPNVPPCEPPHLRRRRLASRTSHEATLGQVRTISGTARLLSGYFQVRSPRDAAGVQARSWVWRAVSQANFRTAALQNALTWDDMQDIGTFEGARCRVAECRSW